MELCSPIADWEEAALQAGWKVSADGINFVDANGTKSWADPRQPNAWLDLCEEHGIDPYEREVFEHWIVSDWLADRLIEKGEKIDKDFAGMIVWARTTSGQGIASDSVIEAIAAEMNAAYPG